MNEHQDAGCTVISPGGKEKMSSSNNSATVEGLRLVSSPGSCTSFKMCSCQGGGENGRLIVGVKNDSGRRGNWPSYSE